MERGDGNEEKSDCRGEWTGKVRREEGYFFLVLSFLLFFLVTKTKNNCWTDAQTRTKEERALSCSLFLVRLARPSLLL